MSIAITSGPVVKKNLAGPAFAIMVEPPSGITKMPGFEMKTLLR
jgi:hypothetical protein